ncbi:hypothetical protein GPALN_005607 [Globodera pallida]|nr:hypothetical protein GPALN_005607 [Globodera pallida]
MSWKETDPIALWRTHSTLPVPESMVAPPRSPEENFANQKGTMRRNVWSSLNEMNAEQRKLFFGRVLHIWPYPWERRAIKWTQSALVFSNVSCAGYIATKVSADVFMADPKIGWLRALRSMPTLIPTFMVSVSAMLASTIMFQFFVYSPFIEHEGLMDRKALFSRIAGIVFLTGTAVPCMFAPVAAQYHNLRMLEAAGKPAIPHNMVIDLIVTCWESTRSIWRKLPFIVAINFGTAALASTAMIWGRDRLHNTMSLDSELIRTLMDESEKSFQEKPAVIVAKYLRNWWNKYSRFDKEIFFPPPMESESGPKWKEPSDGDEAQLTYGISVPLKSWKVESEYDDK